MCISPRERGEGEEEREGEERERGGEREGKEREGERERGEGEKKIEGKRGGGRKGRGENAGEKRRDNQTTFTHTHKQQLDMSKVTLDMSSCCLYVIFGCTPNTLTHFGSDNYWVWSSCD